MNFEGEKKQKNIILFFCYVFFPGHGEQHLLRDMQPVLNIYDMHLRTILLHIHDEVGFKTKSRDAFFVTLTELIQLFEYASQLGARPRCISNRCYFLYRS